MLGYRIYISYAMCILSGYIVICHRASLLIDGTIAQKVRIYYWSPCVNTYLHGDSALGQGKGGG